jgi:hypothetical protein
VHWSHRELYEEEITWEWESNKIKQRVYFEVKTAIKSLGELIRQIRMYQEYVSSGIFVVVCPDDRYKEQLQRQGIAFVKYRPDSIQRKLF